MFDKVWDMVQRGFMKLQYVPIEEQVVVVLTKPLSRVKFEHFQYKLGVVRRTSLERGSDDKRMIW